MKHVQRAVSDDISVQLDARTTLSELLVTENVAVLRRPHRVELARLALQRLDACDDGFFGSAETSEKTLLFLRQQALYLLTHHQDQGGGDA